MALPITIGAVSSNAQVTGTEFIVNISQDTTILAKGGRVNYTITGQNVPEGTDLYYTNAGTTVASDFTDNANQGLFRLSSGTQGIGKTLIDNASVEGKTIIFQVRRTSISGPVIATAQTVNIPVPTPSINWSITVDKSNPYPGQTVNFTVTTVPAQINTLIDFVYTGTGISSIGTRDISVTTNSSGTATGSFVLNNNASVGGSINIEVHTGGPTGPLKITSSSITVTSAPITSDSVISNLFLNNVNTGVWYDISDRSTVFKDFSGNRAEIEDKVLLVLDKSQNLRLGQEKLPTTTTWYNTPIGVQSTVTTLVNGKIQVDKTYDSQAYVDLSLSGAALQPLKTYKLTFTISDYESGKIYFALQNIGANIRQYTTDSFQNNGTYTAYIIVTGTVTTANQPLTSHPPIQYLILSTLGTTKCKVGNFSLKELYGNHAFCFPSAVEADRQNTVTLVPKLSARVNLLNDTSLWNVGKSQTITIEADENATRKNMLLTFSGPGKINFSFDPGSTLVFTAGSNMITIPKNISSITLTVVDSSVTNIDLRWKYNGQSLPEYQRVGVASTDYDISGFPLYLQFGRDFSASNPGFLQTNYNVFAPNKNKLTIMGGFINTNGTKTENTLFRYTYPANDIYFPTPNYRGIFYTSYSRNLYYQSVISGTSGSYFLTTVSQPSGVDSSPQNNVISLKFDYTISTPNCGIMYINGSIAPKSGGNPNGTISDTLATTAVLYIGCYLWDRLYSISGPYTGKMYSLIMADAELTTSKINEIGQYINSKMQGVFWNNAT